MLYTIFIYYADEVFPGELDAVDVKRPPSGVSVPPPEGICACAHNISNGLAKAKQEAEMAKELQKQAAELAHAEKVRKTEMELQRQRQEAELAQAEKAIELQRQKQEAEIAKELQKQEAEIAERKAANELLQQKQAAEIELQR